MFPAGLEPATFRVLGERDNHYTTETYIYYFSKQYLSNFVLLLNFSTIFFFILNNLFEEFFFL